MNDLYTTKLLTGVINQLEPADTKFFLNYFPSVTTHESDVIAFDQTNTGPESLMVMPICPILSQSQRQLKLLDTKANSLGQLI